MLSSPEADPVAAVRPRRAARPRGSRPGPAQVVTGAALGLLLLTALLGPLLTSHDPVVPSGAPYLPPGTAGHLLGTDNLGLDLLTRVVHGLRSSLLAALTVTGVSALVGTVVGTLAGFRGGWLDTALMRTTDLFLAFPAPIVAMAVAAGLGAALSSSMIGIAIVWWPLYARLVRGEVRRVCTSLHVEAARMSGTRGARLVLRHVAPSVLPVVLITASTDVGAVVMVLSGLSFIGLGAPAPAPELGLMAAAGMQYVLTAWWIPVVPGVAVGLTALVFTYAGDGLRDLLRAKGV